MESVPRSFAFGILSASKAIIVARPTWSSHAKRSTGQSSRVSLVELEEVKLQCEILFGCWSYQAGKEYHTYFHPGCLDKAFCLSGRHRLFGNDISCLELPAAQSVGLAVDPSEGKLEGEECILTDKWGMSQCHTMSDNVHPKYLSTCSTLPSFFILFSHHLQSYQDVRWSAEVHWTLSVELGFTVASKLEIPTAERYKSWAF